MNAKLNKINQRNNHPTENHPFLLTGRIFKPTDHQALASQTQNMYYVNYKNNERTKNYSVDYKLILFLVKEGTLLVILFI